MGVGLGLVVDWRVVKLVFGVEDVRGWLWFLFWGGEFGI